MKQLKLVTVIAIAIVGSVSIAGCGGDRTIAEETIAQTSETSDAVSPEVRQQWETVQASSEALSAAIDSLNAQLQGNVDDANIDFQTVATQLNEFRLEVANFQSQLEADSQFLELVPMTAELTTIADEMDRVVDPLENDFDPSAAGEFQEAVGQVQDQLGMEVEQYRGFFGDTTKATLSTYLLQQRDRLNDRMTAINDVIAPPTETGDRTEAIGVEPEETSNVSPSVEPENQKLREYVTTLYTEVERLSRSHQRLQQLVLLLLIGIVFLVSATLGGGWIIFQSQRRRRRQPRNRPDTDGTNQSKPDPILAEINHLYQNQEDLDRRLKQIERQQNYNRVPSPSPSFSPSPTPTWDDRPQTQPQLPPQRSGSPYDRLISVYNTNPSELASAATGVSETKDSIEARRAGRSQRAVFTKDRRGNYWVVQVGNQSYLIPKSDIKINEHSFNAVQALFDCYGYQAGGSDNFALVKPASVVPVVQGKEWELSDRGTLQF